MFSDFKWSDFKSPLYSDSNWIKVKDPLYLSCPLLKLSCPLFKLPDISISAASDDVIPIHGVLNQGVPIRVGIPHFAQTHFSALLASRFCSNLNIQKTFGFKNEIKWGRSCQLKNLFLFTSFLNESNKL